MRNRAPEKLVTDFRALVSDAEELARATAAQTGEKITNLRENAWTTVAVAGVGLIAGLLLHRR